MTHDFDDYLSHNELGLAFDVLVENGASHRLRPSNEFWLFLDAAALEMNIDPDDPVHGHSARTVRRRLARRDRYTCPCCGHRVFDEPPGSYDICPVCFWEDDLSQLRWPNTGGGANDASLIEAQESFRQLGASEARFVEHVRPPKAAHPIDPTWRLFDPSRDAIEPRARGIDYGRTYADDRTAYYYWVDDER